MQTRFSRKLRAAKQAAEQTIKITAPVTIRAAAQPGEDGKPAGPGSFEAVAYSGGMLPGYTAKLDAPVVVDLAGMSVDRNLKANLDHDEKARVGHVTDVANDKKTLSVKGVFSAATPHRDEVRLSAADGFPWEMSVEHTLTKIVRLAAGKQAIVNGQTVSGPAYIARKSRLTGVGFVSHGADPANVVKIAAAAAKKGKAMDFETWLAEQGWDAETLSDSQRTLLRASYDRSKQPAPVTLPADTGADSDDILGDRRLEAQRLQAIKLTARKVYDENPHDAERIESMAREAIDNNWPPHEFELRLLRAMRQPAQPRFASRGGQLDGRVLEAALMRTLRVEGREDMYDETTLQAADERFRHGLCLGELLLMAARQNGCEAYSVGSDLEGVLEAAFRKPAERQLRASGNAMGVLSLPGILGNVANKIVREAFDKVENEWQKLTVFTPVKDFKEISGFSLTGDLTYKPLGPTGEITSGKLGEVSYGNKAKTYARLLGLSREDLINDDPGALNQVPKRLGRGGALAITEGFWTEFLNNASFFSTANGNFDDGADTVFGADGLTLADLQFRAMVDPDGKPLGIIPKLLVVPPKYRVPALRLMRSQKVHEDSASGDDNPWAGMFEVVSSVYMANTTYTGASTLKWYLLGDPNDLPVIETVLLNGALMPTVESVRADVDTLGIVWRGFHDWGHRKQEKRGGFAMKGEV